MSLYDLKWSFPIGLFIGGAIGVFVGWKLSERSKKDVEEAKMEELQAFYDSKIAELKAVQVDYSKLTKDIPETSKNEAQNTEENGNGRPKILPLDTTFYHPDGTDDLPPFDYSKLSHNYTDLQKTYDREADLKGENKPYFPRQISRKQFETPNEFLKVKLTYYEQNGIFTDMNDWPDDTIDEDYFGLDNLSKFGTEEANIDGEFGGDTLYFRDERAQKDFMILYDGVTDFNDVTPGGLCKD